MFHIVLQSIQTHLPHSFTLPSWSQDPPRLHTVLPVWLQRYHPPAIEELSKKTSRFQMVALTLPWCSTICTPKNYIEPKIGGLQIVTHFSKRQYFQVPAVCFRGCTQQNMDKYPKTSIRFLGIQGFPIPSSEWDSRIHLDEQKWELDTRKVTWQARKISILNIGNTSTHAWWIFHCHLSFWG